MAPGGPYCVIIMVLLDHMGGFSRCTARYMDDMYQG